MNVMDLAIRYVMGAIPEAILQRYLTPRRSNLAFAKRGGVQNLEAQIREVLRQTVAVDVNAHGGADELIPLNDLSWKYVTRPERWAVVTIPEELRGGRDITNVTAVVFWPYSIGAIGALPLMGSNTMPMTQPVSSSLVNSAKQLMDSYSMIPWVQTSRAELLDIPNTIAFTDTFSPGYLTGRPGWVRARLSRGDDLVGLPVTTLAPFRTLCLLRIKAWIYNAAIIDLDEGEIQAGYSIGAFRSVIESYSSALEDYETYLREQWRGVEFMSDKSRMYRMVTSMIPAGT